jgi:uncharacterized protein YdbL (DUF1318 family)
MKTKISGMIILLFLFGIFVPNGFCFSEEELKARMLKRVDVINSLKAKGVVGENNRGYLEFRGPKENADVVDAENQDRKTVYAAIAKQQGTGIDVVEKHRAAQIERIAKPGTWLQDANGKWYKKN